MNSPKVPAFFVERSGMSQELAACPECDAARHGSLATDAVCYPHYIRLHKQAKAPCRARQQAE